MRHSCKGCLQGEIEVWIVKTGRTSDQNYCFTIRMLWEITVAKNFNHSGYETVVLNVFISFGVLFNSEETNGRKKRKPSLIMGGRRGSGRMASNNYSLELSWSYCTYSTCSPVE